MTIDELIQRCKCGVYLTVNEHRDSYDTTENALAAIGNDFLGPGARERILAADSIVQLQFYPETPIGFHMIVDATLEDVLARLDAVFEEPR